MRYLRELRRTLVRTGAALAFTGWAGLALAGCGGSGSTGPSGSGSLTVTITAPSGVTPSVTVSGPAGYQKLLTATTTLSGLAPGSYTVAGGAVVAAHAIVATVYEPTISGGTSAVTNGQTATATVAFAARPGTGKLWVTNIGSASSSILGYSADQLAASTSDPPAVSLQTGNAAGVTGAVPGGGGNLWAEMNTDNQVTNIEALVELGPSQLAGSGTLAPAVTVTLATTTREFLQGMAFDANGNAWVANITANSVLEVAASQLGATGNPQAAVVLAATSGSLNGPAGVAFDAAGNLWVANLGGSTVVEFLASQLGASGSPTPAVTLSAASGSLDQPFGLAFDAHGNLWVTNYNGNTVVEFAAGQLSASGSPTPAVTLSATNQSINLPVGLAFDASGDLWVGNVLSHSIVEFGASQLTASGTPTPLVTVSGNQLSAPYGLAFNPVPAGLPLR